MVRRACGLAVALIAVVFAVSAGHAQATARSQLPFYAIGKTVIKLPRGVQPWLPTWMSDGTRILFEDQVNGTIWDATPNGEAHCITCGFTDAPKIVGGFTYAFPGDSRLFISHGLGGSGGIDSGPDADAWVLQCAPSVYDCKRHRYLPVDMSEDKVGNPVIVQRRTWHLAPDGVHLAWTEVRLGATLMIVGKLRREADKYLVVDQRVVNPPGPLTPTSTNPFGWANAGQLYELKSFADGGRSILAVGEPDGDPDVIKINLATGQVTQLTRNLAWDEDGAIAPDGQLYTVESARERPGGVQALGWIPELEPFFDYPIAATIAVSGSEWIDYQCDLSPWLLPSSGDDNGTLVGQPLETYSTNGIITAGDQLAGQQMWSPNSTEVLMQETTRQRPPKGSNSQISQIGESPNRLVIARIARSPTKPLPIVGSNVGSWAPSPQDYHATIAADTDVTLIGAGGGTAKLSLSGSLAGGTWSVTYDNYSQDGRTFLNGTERASGSPDATFTLTAAVTVSGTNTGRLNADMTWDDSRAGHPVTGYYDATYDGRAAPALATASTTACYRYLPHNTPLTVDLSRDGGRLTVKVSADIDGERRPVKGAVVTLGTARAVTGSSGRVSVPDPARRRRLTVSAGSTFTSATREVSA